MSEEEQAVANARVERPYAYCCAEGGGSVEGCDCVNKDHGTAWVTLAGDKAGGARQYSIGPLTLSDVFEAAELTDMSDMQTVLDAVEQALALRHNKAAA